MECSVSICLSPSGLMCYCFLIFYLHDLSTDVSGVLKFPTIFKRNWSKKGRWQWSRRILGLSCPMNTTR